MALEKIIKFVKINPITTAIYGLSGSYTALRLLDGINLDDATPLALTGIIACLATNNVLSKKIIYETISFSIDTLGFDHVVQYKHLRKFAKLYAEEQNLMEEYNGAVQRCDN